MLAAAWVTAGATFGLLAGAIITAVFAVRAFTAQSRELGLLQEQVETERSEREREADERRRTQAARVYMTLVARRRLVGPEHVVVPAILIATVRNTSEQPVYDLRVHWTVGAPAVQLGAEDRRGTLGPHEDVSAERPVPEGVTLEHLTPIAYFRDAAGARWTLASTGQLDPVPAHLAAGAPLIATEFANRPRNEDGTLTARV